MVFPQRAAAPCLAIAVRCSAVRILARRQPPLLEESVLRRIEGEEDAEASLFQEELENLVHRRLLRRARKALIPISSEAWKPPVGDC